MGYSIYLLLDEEEHAKVRTFLADDLVQDLLRTYLGYPEAVRTLDDGVSLPYMKDTHKGRAFVGCHYSNDYDTHHTLCLWFANKLGHSYYWYDGQEKLSDTIRKGLRWVNTYALYTDPAQALAHIKSLPLVVRTWIKKEWLAHNNMLSSFVAGLDSLWADIVEA